MLQPVQNNNNKIDIKKLSLEELMNFVQNIGSEKYRALQIYQWLWQKNIESFDLMTNISRNLRLELNRRFYISQLKLLRSITGQDGTTKFTFELEDRNIIESVLIFDGQRRTICLSTQVGCKLGCRFCATARINFKRNLFWHEIVEQIQAIMKISNITPTNIVFMGMGEPLLNLYNVIKAIAIINSDYGLKIGARRITVSTAGIPEGIKKIAELPIKIRLAISLNATTDPIRSALMPINKRYPLKLLLATARKYTKITHRRLTFEYVLINGVNDQKADAMRLSKILRDIPCKINIIPFNPFPGSQFLSPKPEQVAQFVDLLHPLLPAVTIRKSRGSDVLAGCGQLAADCITGRKDF
jgi:23S rRNA (adenine2503-C2)-methyltransferase